MSRSALIPSSPHDRIIVALDEPEPEKCLTLIETLGKTISFYKIGLILFASSNASLIFRELRHRGKRIFCDLKVDDTPNTIEKAVYQWVENGITLVTLRDNPATVRSAVKARGTHKFPLFLCVPLLSTLSPQDLAFLLKKEENQVTESFLQEEVHRRTNRLLNEGCDGFIASGITIQWIRSAHPSALIVTPGVRTQSSLRNEHLRVTTPREAISYGADYLVVGRPVYQSENPNDTVQEMAGEILKGLAHLTS